MIVYLDSSAIVKRYLVEPGSEIINEVYSRALEGEIRLAISIWNIGEVLGVFDKYRRKEYLDEKEYEKVRRMFISETIRMLKLRLLKIVPVKTRILIETWSIIERYHVYEADALQIASARYVKANKLYTGDKKVHEVAVKEGVESVYVGQ